MSVAYTTVSDVSGDLVVKFSPAEMASIGEQVVSAIKERIGKAIDVNDQAAPELSEAYKKVKLKRGAKPVRDMRLSGQTLNSLKVLTSGENSVEIGFDNPQAALIVSFDAKYDEMWGLSPADQVVAPEAVRAQLEQDSNKSSTARNNFLLIEGS